LFDEAASLAHNYLNARATICDGSNEIQRNIIAENVGAQTAGSDLLSIAS
jgi:hypothetical protein